eukprot:scaffold57603_cov23-Tisochrysis_lutea.AAC.1
MACKHSRANLVCTCKLHSVTGDFSPCELTMRNTQQTLFCVIHQEQDQGCAAALHLHVQIWRSVVLCSH